MNKDDYELLCDIALEKLPYTDCPRCGNEMQECHIVCEQCGNQEFCKKCEGFEWTPIEKQYPKNNEEVIVHLKKDGREWVTTGMFSVDQVITSVYKRSPVWLIHHDASLDKYIVGWMSLPEVPK